MYQTSAVGDDSRARREPLTSQLETGRQLDALKELPSAAEVIGARRLGFKDMRPNDPDPRNPAAAVDTADSAAPHPGVADRGKDDLARVDDVRFNATIGVGELPQVHGWDDVRVVDAGH
jgi:hypothetical protein